MMHQRYALCQAVGSQEAFGNFHRTPAWSNTQDNPPVKDKEPSLTLPDTTNAEYTHTQKPALKIIII